MYETVMTHKHQQMFDALSLHYTAKKVKKS